MIRPTITPAAIALSALAIIVACDANTGYESAQPVSPEIKKLKPKLGFTQMFPDPKFENLRMLGKVTKNGVTSEDGILLRVLRFKNIADAVDRRYSLPENTVLAFVAQETGGADILPNGSGDGGVGLAHSQPATAHEYGLVVYQGCKKLVSHAHGRAIASLIASKKSDRRKLVGHDDRFHPVINLDMVGRVLALNMSLAKAEKLDPLQYATLRYSGRPEYWGKIQSFRKLLGDKARIEKVRVAFNKANPRLLVNGKRGGFDEYIATCAEQNRNYGLDTYKLMARYAAPSAKAMLAKYD